VSTPTPCTGDLLYTEIEDDLRASVRSLLDKRAHWDTVLARTETADTTDRDLWNALAQEVGCAALAVPEDAGGAGASWREVAVVAEELGRAVAPVPFLGTAVATAVLLDLGERELLGEIAAGEIVGALAVPFGTAPGTAAGTVELRDGVLHGTVTGVADAAIADVLLVPVGDALHRVGSAADRLRRTEVVSLDMTRPLVDLTLDGVAGRRVAQGPEVARAVATGLRAGAVVLASEQLGLAERCLETTVEYVGLRRQFGRTLGSYQALKHRLADLWVQITQARAVARYAAECAATGSADLPVAAALAQAHCSVVVQQAAEECMQMHGGIGFTWEHPAHLYLKRAKSSAIALGTPERHRAALSRLVDLPASET
jgi:alkylation response protein AidB-like acyl-CoA dehydrogenase